MVKEMDACSIHKVYDDTISDLNALLELDYDNWRSGILN